MKESIIAKLTLKDDKYACALADKIISGSQETDEWYEYFDDFASLLDHPKSLVRNRVLYILAANAQWDEENRFDAILPDFLTHITDEKPITARQCVKALARVGRAKPQYIPRILSCLKRADLSEYKDTLVKKKNVFVMGTVKNAENTILNQKGKEAWLAKEITNPRNNHSPPDELHILFIGTYKFMQPNITHF